MTTKTVTSKSAPMGFVAPVNSKPVVDAPETAVNNEHDDVTPKVDAATGLYRALDAALSDVLATGQVSHANGQELARALARRIPGGGSAKVFGGWIMDKAADNVDFATCMIVNSVVQNPPEIAARPKLTAEQKYATRILILMRARDAIYDEMEDDDTIDHDKVEELVNDGMMPEHLAERVAATVAFTKVGTEPRGRKLGSKLDK